MDDGTKIKEKRDIGAGKSVIVKFVTFVNGDNLGGARC